MSGRIVHCKRERYDVYIGRPSKWGNPFPVPKGYDRVADPERILERYEAHVRATPELMAALPELAGKVLGCWCAPQACHGDVLLRLVAQREEDRRILRELTAKFPRREATPEERAIFNDFRRREAAGELKWVTREERDAIRARQRQSDPKEEK